MVCSSARPASPSREQALTGLADQRELLVQAGQAVQPPPATADQDSLAAATRLRACWAIRPGRSGPGAGVVVDRRVRQRIGLAHRGLQARRGRRWRARRGAEEQQVLRQRRSDTRSGRAGTRYCASRREATRLVKTSKPGSRPWACASKSRGELPQRRHLRIGGGRWRRQPGAAFAHRCSRQHRLRRAHHAQHVASIVVRAAASSAAQRHGAWCRFGSSRQCQSTVHRSAGWMRSAPARPPARRGTAGTSPAPTPACRPAGGQVIQQRERHARWLDDRAVTCSALRRTSAPAPRMARSSSAGRGRPTSSSAPTPWWMELRARAALAGSTVSTSEPRAASASFRQAAQRLGAPFERRAAQFVQHPGQGAQVVGGCARASWHSGRFAVPCGARAVGGAGQAILNRATDCAVPRRCATARAPSRRWSACLRRSARHREDVLDVGGHHVGRAASCATPGSRSARSARRAGASRGRSRSSAVPAASGQAGVLDHFPTCCAPWRHGVLRVGLNGACTSAAIWRVASPSVRPAAALLRPPPRSRGPPRRPTPPGWRRSAPARWSAR